MENISIHHFFLYLPCTFPQKAQGWARICALYMEKTFTSVWLSGFRTSHLLTCRKNRWQPVTSSWYVYLRTVPSFRERTCRIHIGVGFLRCSFLTGGHAKALELGTGKGKIPTPFLYTGSSYVGFNMSVGSPDE